MTHWLGYEQIHGPDHTVIGTVVVWPHLDGRPGIPGREILVYLPPSLAAAGSDGAAAHDRRYPVLYFHDGQNVFDELTSYVGEWHADETLEMLAGEGLEAIAVAVPNAGEARMDEYNPWRGRDPHGWCRWRWMGGKGDAYLAYLIETVKPLIDRSFPTSRRREETGIVGSSMGGLVSLYALLVCGDVFGLAGVLSPSLAWSDYRVLRLIEERGLPPSRIHLDWAAASGAECWPMRGGCGTCFSARASPRAATCITSRSATRHTTNRPGPAACQTHCASCSPRRSRAEGIRGCSRRPARGAVQWLPPRCGGRRPACP